MANLSSPLHLFLNPSRIQIQTQFFCGSQFITIVGPTLFFSPVFSLSPPLLLCLSLSPLGHYRPPVRPSSPRFSLFITLGQTPSPVLITSPSHRLFHLISATTHSNIRMGSPKGTDLERELAYLWPDGEQGGYNLHDGNDISQVSCLSRTH
jgi:hypothetical protein